MKAWKCGTSILVIPSWAKLVTRYGTFWGNLVQWIRFNNLLEWNLGFLNAYAPNNLLKICRLWEYLNATLPKDYHWMTGYNINTVDKKLDKTSSW